MSDILLSFRTVSIPVIFKPKAFLKMLLTKLYSSYHYDFYSNYTKVRPTGKLPMGLNFTSIFSNRQLLMNHQIQNHGNNRACYSDRSLERNQLHAVID